MCACACTCPHVCVCAQLSCVAVGHEGICNWMTELLTTTLYMWADVPLVLTNFSRLANEISFKPDSTFGRSDHGNRDIKTYHGGNIFTWSLYASAGKHCIGLMHKTLYTI